MNEAARLLPAGVRHVLQRARAHGALAAARRLHLSCCGRLLDGWTNLGLTPHGTTPVYQPEQPLPLPAHSIECIYVEHFIEHLTLHQAGKLLMECQRLLRPGGVLRLSTPDLRAILGEYVTGQLHPGVNIEWTPLTPCRLVNDVLRQWDRQFLYDQEELTRLLVAAGFTEARRVQRAESTYAPLRTSEPCNDRLAMIIEAVRGT